jgi:hypothetical protein
MPQDLKLEIDLLTREEAVAAANTWPELWARHMHAR